MSLLSVLWLPEGNFGSLRVFSCAMSLGLVSQLVFNLLECVFVCFHERKVLLVRIFQCLWSWEHYLFVQLFILNIILDGFLGGFTHKRFPLFVQLDSYNEKKYYILLILAVPVKMMKFLTCSFACPYHLLKGGL